MTGFQVNPLGVLIRSMDLHHYVLCEDLPFECPDGSIITCLNGTMVSRLYRRPILSGPQIDGASTPRQLWGTGLPPFGWYALPVGGHDCGFQGKTKPVLDMEQSNQFLLWALESSWPLAMQLGVSRVEYEVQKFAIYQGVRLFGESAYLEDRTTLSNVRTTETGGTA
jgi:hypothetical protein